MLARSKFYLNSSSGSRAIKAFRSGGMYTIYTLSNKNKASSCLSVLSVFLSFRSSKPYVFRSFDASKGGGEPKRLPFLKSVTYFPTMMTLGTVTIYLKKIKKYINHVTHALSSADISIFSSEISNFCYIKKYRYRLHFNPLFLILLSL